MSGVCGVATQALSISAEVPAPAAQNRVTGNYVEITWPTSYIIKITMSTKKKITLSELCYRTTEAERRSRRRSHVTCTCVVRPPATRVGRTNHYHFLVEPNPLKPIMSIMSLSPSTCIAAAPCASSRRAFSRSAFFAAFFSARAASSLSRISASRLSKSNAFA